MISVDHKGKKVLIKLENMEHIFETGLRHGLNRAGKVLEKHAKDGVKNPPKTGRKYRYKGRMLRAGAAGEYPRNRSGKLRRSIGHTVQGSRRMFFGIGEDYALSLEDGRKNMLPRPTLKKTTDAKADQVNTIISQSVIEEIENG